jgi:hypothetical protein
MELSLTRTPLRRGSDAELEVSLPPFSEVRPDYAEPACSSTVEAQITTTAMRHNPALGIMATFMKNRPVKIYRLEESRRRRHLDVIGARHIEGAGAADADIGAGRADQRLCLRQDKVLGKRLRRWCYVRRKILALVGVEDREALEERIASGSSPVSAARVRSR